MLNLATSENIESICSDDPVRPSIPYTWRIEQPNKFTYYLDTKFMSEEGWIWNRPQFLGDKVGKKKFASTLRSEIDAVCCVALLDDVPTTEEELMSYKEGKNAIFYTVWSKKTKRKGKGREVLNSTMQEISKQSVAVQERLLPVSRYVTLSPKTEMATKFHLNNGAILLSENELTLNFEYAPPVTDSDLGFIEK